jgi:hypothetical protein
MKAYWGRYYYYYYYYYYYCYYYGFKGSRVGRFGPDACGLGQGLGCCEYGNGPSGCIKSGE